MFPKNFLWGGAVAANQCEGAYTAKMAKAYVHSGRHIHTES